MDILPEHRYSAHEKARLVLLIDKHKEQFPAGLPVVWGYERDPPGKGSIFCSGNDIWLHPDTWPKNEREHLFRAHCQV